MKRAFVTLILAVILAIPNFSLAAKSPIFDVQTSTPISGVSDFPVNQAITIKFTRNIGRGTGVINFKDRYWRDIPFTEEIQGDTLIIKSVNKLEYNHLYTIEVFPDAVKNIEDNSENYFRDKFVLSISTPYFNQEEFAKLKKAEVLSMIGTQKPITLQLFHESTAYPGQAHILQKDLSAIYILSTTNGNYKLWTSNPQVASLQTKGDTLIVNGLNTGAAQIAVRNLVDNTKVVLNVVVQ
ncbi:hypothetical protein EDM57_21055 [Brevibacillus gelatini]|uniref:SbsA Ig-like domain-containing protein n=1 Tax=Brevibacillus gelatini TaxID=1655277 RepID=A0A3M8ANA0_9BACL|nr:Ig-like domain-containing protein [Brevibacillus gelatini]RNB52678.1 hypothetical protein EDM57_21055 [Brevibacillus gelatini]